MHGVQIGKLYVGHVVAQAFFLQAFELLVLMCALTAPFTSDDVGEGCILRGLASDPGGVQPPRPSIV